MNLKDCFAKSKKAKFIPYISLGDPDYEKSTEWADALIRGGADILELGIPFSDPVADGPVIQASYKRALTNTTFSMQKILDTTNRIHNLQPNIPLLYLTYFNLIFSYGIEKFFGQAYQSGIRGVVIPDIPFDTRDSIPLFQTATQNQVDIIQLVTPATNEDRIQQMKEFSSGFIYYVTSFGVTGERANFHKDMKSRIKKVKKIMSMPVCAGFGISNPAQAKEISEYADGIIIGSAIQRIIEKNGQELEKCKQELFDFANSIVLALH